MNTIEQRSALITAIRRNFSDAKIECSDLPWLRVPKVASMDGPLATIFTAMHHHRGHAAFATEGRKLACDIVIPSQRLIVEYDERQHFSAPRAIALRLYPRDTPVLFDTAEWVAQSEAIAATDNNPPYRDEQRAFYDSVRDILAGANGYKVVRLKHGAFNWQTDDADREILRRLTTSPSQVTIPRFATVCIKGKPAKDCRTHARSLMLLSTVVREINNRWGKLDAIVFPGGFLSFDQPIGKLTYTGRVRDLNSAGFVKPITDAVGALDRSPGTLNVIGVDGASYSNGDGGTNYVSLWTRAGSSVLVGRSFRRGMNRKPCFVMMRTLVILTV